MSLYNNYFGISEDTALPDDKDAIIGQMTELLREYRENHSDCFDSPEDDVMAAFDDRCPLCIKADLLLKENK